jgi:methylmalonyl-CoA/ethylmalonyl-CoA epimerase
MNFHHLGIATNNIGKSLSFVKNTFEVISYTDTIYDPKQDVELVLIVTKSVNLELVSGSTVEKFVEKRQSYYHICYEVVNMDNAIESFDNSILVSSPKEAILFNNRKVAFLLTPIGLIELLESEK